MIKVKSSYLLTSSLLVAVAATARADGDHNTSLRRLYDQSTYMTSDVTFPAYDYIVAQGGDIDVGRMQFGIRQDSTGDHIDNTLGGLFQGPSAVYEGCVVSNGKVCASCHRPDGRRFRLPVPPLRNSIPASDPLLNGESAESQGDPRTQYIFEQLGLAKIRVNRFNPLLPETSPFRKAFAWRKTQTIINLAFGQSMLTDGRARHGIEQARGAAFTHTQDTDNRFDDIVNPKLPNIAAYQMTEFSQPELADLLDPSAPLHDALVNDPFYTVHPKTRQERRGQEVFAQYCLSCHNTPNVFGNVEHVPGTPPNFPPIYGHTMDVGVAQQNMRHLDFRYYDVATATYSPIVLPLVRQDGVIVNVTVVDDLGSAFVSGRYEDMHRFKVPQLRNIKDLGPYFHDDSAATLEDVVDYFNSDAYNDSPDGSTHPIHMSFRERNDLLAFLKIL
jgi:cytochrome c peroxidase